MLIWLIYNWERSPTLAEREENHWVAFGKMRLRSRRAIALTGIVVLSNRSLFLPGGQFTALRCVIDLPAQGGNLLSHGIRCSPVLAIPGFIPGSSQG